MQNNPGRLISILYRKAQVYWTQSLKEYQITSAEYPILLRLYAKEGVTQEEIVAELEMDKSAIARALQSLIDKGFVEKQKDEQDRRCNRIYLTDKGYGVRGTIEEAKQKWNEILMKNMTEEEQREMIRLLGQSVKNLKRE